MSGVACGGARTFPTPPPRPRLQFSVGNTGFLHFHAGTRTDIPYLPRSNTSLKFLKRFMQVFPTSLTLVLHSPAPDFGFLHLGCLQIPFPRRHLQSSHSPPIPDSLAPIARPYTASRAVSPMCIQHTADQPNQQINQAPSAACPTAPPSPRQSKSQSPDSSHRQLPNETKPADTAEFVSHNRFHWNKPSSELTVCLTRPPLLRQSKPPPPDSSRQRLSPRDKASHNPRIYLTSSPSARQSK